MRRCSSRAATTASSARSWACGPPAWKLMTNGWPLVCMTAWAIWWDRALIRSTISVHTAARTSAPASRQAGIAASAASMAASTSSSG